LKTILIAIIFIKLEIEKEIKEFLVFSKILTYIRHSPIEYIT